MIVETALVYTVVAANTWIWLWSEYREPHHGWRENLAIFIVSLAWPLVLGCKLWEKLRG